MSHRDDEAWLVARETGAPAPAIDAARAAEYGRLEKLLTDLPDRDPPAGWERRVIRSLQPTPGQRARWSMALAAAALALVALGALLGRPPNTSLEPRLSMEVVSGTDVMRGHDVATRGDTLVVRLELPTSGELRVYKATGPLVVRCPGDAQCLAENGGRVISVRVPLVEVGTLRAVAMTGPPAAPTGEGLQADLDAAERLGTSVMTVPPVEVR